MSEVLSEWKDIAETLSAIAKKRIPANTVKRWNRQYLRLIPKAPYISKQRRVVIEKALLVEWYKALITIYPALSKTQPNDL